MSVFVCLSVCLSVNVIFGSQVITSPDFPDRLPVNVARFPAGDTAIRNVLPVL